MIDIENIRRQPEMFRQAIAAKRIPLELDELLQIDEQRRNLSKQVNQLREQRNRVSELVSSDPDNRDQYIAESKSIGQELASQETALRTLDSNFARLMALVPSVPCDGTPDGDSDGDNFEFRRVGMHHVLHRHSTAGTQAGPRRIRVQK